MFVEPQRKTIPDAQVRSPNLDHVRLADERDEEQLYLLCRLIHEEIGFHEISWPRVEQRIHLACQHSEGLIGVIGPHHDLKAAICLGLVNPWYSDAWLLQEYFCFVRQDSRNSYYSRDLIAYAKQLAEQSGLDLMIGVLTEKRTEGKCRLYRRWLPKLGEYFMYRPRRQTMDTIRLAGAKPANEVAAE